MLSIYLNDWKDEKKVSEFEGRVSAYFDEVFESDWFNDSFVKRIVNEIDDTVVVSDYVLHNKTLGNIPPQYLSSGCKGLILLYKEGIKISGDRLGDNCVPLLLEIAEKKDICISLAHIMRFPKEFTAMIENTGVIVHSYGEFLDIYVEVL